MSEQRERSLVPELMSRNGLAGHIDGVEGIEPGDTDGASQMAGADQVGFIFAFFVVIDIAARPEVYYQRGQEGRFIGRSRNSWRPGKRKYFL